MKTLYDFYKHIIYLFFIATLIFIAPPGWSKQPFNIQKNYSQYLKKEILNVEGTIEIRAILYLNKNHGESLQYLLHAKDGQSYYLRFINDEHINLTTGSIVKIEKAISITTEKDLPELVVSENDILIIKKALQLPDAFGPQRTVVLLVNFQDQPNNQPFTPAAVQHLVFDSVNRQFIESSYNQTNLVGNVYGWMTIPINSTTECDTLFNAIPGLAATAAAQRGIDLSPYIHRIYLFPSTNCDYAGAGTIGRDGAYSNTWLNGYNDLHVTAHELGHNDGLFHSQRIICPNGGTQGSCTSDEYGDYADSMGWGYGTHFNAYQKERLGWLNYGTSPLIKTITASGNYSIHPYETQDSGAYIKGLKILRKNLSDGSQDYYYIEYRTPTGFDAPLGSCGSNCNFTKGVLLHQGNKQNPNSSNIFFPNSNTSNPNIIALLPGQTFTDPMAANGGVKVTLNSVTSWLANMNIQFGDNPNCFRKSPVLTISPSGLQSVNAGESKTYSVTITNNDSAACNPSLFAISSSKNSSKMIITPSVNSLTIAPGNNTSFTVNVSTALNTSSGIYLFAILAVNTTSNNSGGVTGGFKI